ncbi:MAG: hypothetical protein KDB00_24625 [Planctomycetales bacterium]|nr:hypothetical protein [Planctomycetales bacterium]
MVIRNWQFGWYIVEFEQNGTDRATYGKETLERLSSELKLRIGRGFSVDNLQLMRRFYTGFSGVLEISETPSRSLPGIYETLSTELAIEGIAASSSPERPRLTAMVDALADRFSLSWSHYVTLLTIGSGGGPISFFLGTRRTMPQIDTA